MVLVAHSKKQSITCMQQVVYGEEKKMSENTKSEANI